MKPGRKDLRARRACLRTCGVGAAVLCLALASGAWAQPARKSAPRTVKRPVASARIAASVSDGVVKIRLGKKKLSNYDRGSKLKPVEYSVHGPTPIRILNRFLLASLSSPVPSELTYRIEIDGRALRTVKSKAAPSRTARLSGGGAVSVLSTRFVQVPAGIHRIRVYPVDDRVLLAAKVLRGSGKKVSGWTPFAPESFERALRLHIKDSETTAYRMTPEKPVGLTLFGPMKLRATSRLDFGSAAGMTQAYVLKVALNGKPWKSFSLKARASHTAVYPEMNEITPGMAKTVVLSVPSGRNEIVFALAGTTAGGGTLQLHVPKRALRTTAGNGHAGSPGRI
jgi:hypothetical protein